jgi:predicted Fe-S protein YdhL (DUF1289 family)
MVEIMSESNTSKAAGRVTSPCISICALNDDDVCMGCYRTSDEIRNWVMMDDEARMGVIKVSMKRSRAENPFA